MDTKLLEEFGNEISKIIKDPKYKELGILVVASSQDNSMITTTDSRLAQFGLINCCLEDENLLNYFKAVIEEAERIGAAITEKRRKPTTVIPLVLSDKSVN